MGSCCSCCKSSAKDTYIVLVVGIDSAGKSTIMATLRGDYNETVPTVGLGTATEAKIKGVRSPLAFYDLGGGHTIRDVWCNYFPKVHGIMYVVDSADPARLAESRKELDAVLESPVLMGKPLLVFGNKQDKAGALDEAQLSIGLGLNKLVMSRHQLVKCVASPKYNDSVVDDRIQDGLRWLGRAIETDFEQLTLRIEKDTKDYDEQQAERAKILRDKQIEEEKKRKEAAKSSSILCKFCDKNPATKKSGASGWRPVCNECNDILVAGGTPVKGGAGASAGAASGDAKEAEGAGAGAASGGGGGGGGGAEAKVPEPAKDLTPRHKVEVSATSTVLSPTRPDTAVTTTSVEAPPSSRVSAEGGSSVIDGGALAE